MATERIITAAGGVVWRKRTGPGSNGVAIEVLLVHRPKYDDWTLPKGKAEAGESLAETAVREIVEEAGLRVRLGLPLTRIEYEVTGGTKQVDYWCARAVGSADTSGFAANHEVDELRWVRLAKAPESLTFAHDRDVLDAFRSARDAGWHKARTLIVQRHAKADSRATFAGDDVDRPLDSTGAARARRLVPILAAYGIRHVVSSPALRCVQTVEPYARSINTFLEIDDRMLESAKPALVRHAVAALLERKKPTVVSTHQPTLPTIFAELGVDRTSLAPGAAVVIHHRKGTVCAVEHIAG